MYLKKRFVLTKHANGFSSRDFIYNYFETSCIAEFTIKIIICYENITQFSDNKLLYLAADMELFDASTLVLVFFTSAP